MMQNEQNFKGFNMELSMKVSIFDALTSSDLPGCDYLSNPKVNLKSGRLLYGMQDIAIGMKSYEIATSHVYSSNMSTGAKTLFSKYGNGWKLDLDQYIISNSVNDQFKYIDQLGYVHDFEKLETGRYYDKTDASIVLEITSDGYVLKDRNNNISHFNSDGRITYMQSGMNSKNKKIFVYSGENISKIYDSRKQTDYLQFNYSNGRLNQISKYRSGSLLESIFYYYDANGNLTSTKVIVGNAAKTRNIYVYDANNLLTLIATPETQDAIKITYEGSEVNKISNGKVGGASTNYEKSFSAVTYTQLLPLDNNQRHIINERGIRNLIQWDNHGNIVSCFEADSTGRIKTWEREGGERVVFSNPDSSETINGRGVAKVGSLSRVGNVNFSKFSGSNKCFLCSFYLKVKSKDNPAMLKLILCIDDDEFVVPINGYAIDVWQKVTVPLQFNSVPTGQLTIIAEITTLNENSKSAVIAEMFIKPSAIQKNYVGSVKILYNLLSYSPNKFYVKDKNNAATIVNFSKLYMSESELINSILHPIVKSNGVYELVGNEGKSRITDITSMYADVSGTTNLLLDNTKIQTKTFGADGRLDSTTTYSRKTVNGKAQYITEYHKYAQNNSDTDVYTYSITDEFGNVIEKKSQYGRKLEIGEDGKFDESNKIVSTVTKNTYTEDGDLQKVTIVDDDGNETTVAEYSESENGTNYKFTEESETLECETVYNNRDLLESVQKTWYNNNTKRVGGKTTYGYNGYYDRLKTVTFTYTDYMGKVHQSVNSIEYPQADKVKFSDGGNALYIKENPVDGESEFGYSTSGGDQAIFKQFEGISFIAYDYYANRAYNTISKIYCESDVYGNLSLIYENDEDEPKVIFEYDSCNESDANKLLKQVEDNFSNETINYEYDSNLNLKKWYKNGIEVNTEEDDTKTYVFKAGVMPDKTPESFSSKSDINGTTNYLNGSKVQDVSYDYYYGNLGQLIRKKSGNNVLTCTPYAYEFANSYYNLTTVYKYSGYGNIIGEEFKINNNYANINRSYSYDEYAQLDMEINSQLRIHREYAYDNYGRMIKFGDSACTYNTKGQLTKFGSKTYTYDDFGNRLTCGNETYNWTRGRLLSRYKNAAGEYHTYRYDWQGQRTGKNNKIFYYEGDKLLGEYENTVGGKRIWYYYDESGICGIRYNGKDYAYIKNIHGDVIALREGEDIVAWYEYDAWGNHKVYSHVLTPNSSPAFIGNVNPIRYRGYYYDVESGLYYLHTRYYDPTIGQFISPDSPKYLDPETINGLNLYAYCGFNPVMNVDPMGTSWSSFWSKVGRFIAGAFITFTGALVMASNLEWSLLFSNTSFQAGFSRMMYGGFMMASVFDSQIYKDMNDIGWNPYNSDAKLAYDTAYNGKVSFYKGVPIIKINDIRSGTFGAIWLGTGDGGFTSNPPDLVRHEWGHVPQNIALGLVRFGVCIGIPSWLKFGDYYGTTGSYYNAPWEASASIMGGVQSLTYSTKDKWLAFGHLAVAWFAGVFSYLFAIH